jgi:hypothetical protein
MTTTTNANGTTRKSLAAQIDRLDSVLDGLADGINETVVDAVQAAVGQAVRQAVQAALTEVLTNPELHERLRPHFVPAAAPEPNAPVVSTVLQRAWGWLAGKVRSAWQKTTSLLRRAWFSTVGAMTLAGTKSAAIIRQGTTEACAKVQRACRRAKALLTGGWLRILALGGLAVRLRKPALVALGVGSAVAAGCCLAGPVVASVVSGVSSLLLTLVTAVLGPVWQLLDAADDHAM